MIYLEWMFLILILFSALYQVLALFCTWQFLRMERNRGAQSCHTPVSILKPLKGRDDGFRENIDTFCSQEYPVFEVLLGFTNPTDEAIPSARDIAASGCEHPVRVIINTHNSGTNKKVSNLQGLVGAAAHPLLVISDSDMRADRFYLRDIVGEYYQGKNTGLVTCLYKVSYPDTIGAALESLTTALDFIPSVLVARRLEGITFGLGASILLSRQALADIGGLAVLADYLADDYQIGNRLWKKGYTNILSRVVIEHVTGPLSIAGYCSHQLRWARTYCASRPYGYLGYGITHLFPLTLALLFLLGPTASALSLLGATLCFRFALAVVLYTKEIRTRKWLRWLVLLPVKDLFSFCIWIWSFVSNRVTWRKTTYAIGKDGTMVAVK